MNRFILSQTKIALLVLFLIIASLPIKGQVYNWSKALSGSGGEKGLGISSDSEGNVYSTGWFNYTADFDPGPLVYDLVANNSSDIYISKLNSAGDFAWAKAYGGSGADQGTAIYASPFGHVLATGFFLNTSDFNLGQTGSVLTSFGDFDGFVLKLDSAGNYLWVKQIGGPGLEQMESICEDAAGNIYVSGSFTNTCDFDPDTSVFALSSTGANGSDGFIVKLDSDGNFIWARQFGGIGSENTISVKADQFGNVYALGLYRLTAEFNYGGPSVALTSLGLDDIFICKLDSSGNLIYAKSYGGPNADNVSDMVIDAQANIYCTGFFLGSADFDPGPNSFTMNSGTIVDSYVCKFDSAGTLIWVKQFDGNDSQLSTSIAIDAMTNVYTAGWFNSQVDFDPDTSSFMLNTNGSSDIFVCKLDDMGNFVWAHNAGSVGFDQVTAIHVKNNRLYITGEFRDSVDFDFLSGISFLSVQADRDAFVAKYSLDNATGLDPVQQSISGFKVYPNPSSADLSVFSDGQASLFLFSVTGQLLLEKKLSPGQNTLNVESLPASCYLITLHSDKEKKTFRWIKTQSGLE
jgi:hypothetical protein